jgi:hypothetical protein
MLRPRKKVLDDTALVPADNFTTPPATLTHALRKTQPYYYDPGSDSPDGSFAAGTCVKLLDDDGELAWVVSEQGLRVATECAGLRPLGAKDKKTTETKGTKNTNTNGTKNTKAKPTARRSKRPK